MAHMTLDELNAHIDKVIKDYKGDIVHLSDAMGAARMGHHFGWRVLRLVISSVTYRRHQKILGLDFKEVLPEITEYTEKSAGYMLVKRLGNFWDVVNGLVKIDKEQKTKLV